MVALLVGLGWVPGSALLPPRAALAGNVGSFGNEGSKGLLHGWKREVEVPLSLLACLAQVSLANIPAQSWSIMDIGACTPHGSITHATAHPAFPAT